MLTARVWHEPDRIGAVRVPVWDDVMLRVDGFHTQGRGPDHLGAAEPVNVRTFRPEQVNG